MKSNRVVIYSYLTEGKESGHLILDDEFWMKYFNSNKIEALLFSSEYSCAYQKERFPSASNRLISIPGFLRIKQMNARLQVIMKVIFTPQIKDSVVVVQGFEEMSFLIFLLKNAFNRNKYVLVLTNNISTNRLVRGGWKLKCLLAAIFARVDVILYHTSFELHLLKSFAKKSNWLKFEYVKYHLMCKKSGKQLNSDLKQITYYGPVKPDKPIKPFLDLIEADQDGLFDYVIYNPGIEFVSVIEERVNGRPNVVIINKFLSNDEYNESVNKSAYIFLPHNTLYEGKLSGNLCDCVSNRVPFISDKVSPTIEFVELYGEMGYIYDFSVESWPKKFITEHSFSRRAFFITSIEKMLEDYSFESLKKELDSIFEKVS